MRQLVAPMWWLPLLLLLRVFDVALSGAADDILDPHPAEPREEISDFNSVREEHSGTSISPLLHGPDDGRSSVNDVAPLYRFENHINTSADERQEDDAQLHPFFRIGGATPVNASCSSTSSHDSSSSMHQVEGPNTPPPPTVTIAALRLLVGRRLGTMEMLGQSLQAQMLAQELLRVSVEHREAYVRGNLALLEDVLHEFCDPGFEIGVVLDEEQGKWLAEVIAKASHVSDATSESLPDGLQHDQDPDEDDVASLMGAPGRRGRDDRDEWRDSPRSRSRTGDGRSGQARQRNQRGHGPRGSGHPETEVAPWRRRSPTVGRDARSPTSGGGPCTASIRGPPSSTRTPREDALSYNRIIWRGLLGMDDEGPGQDFSSYVPSAVDPTAMSNIEATVTNMSDAERVAFVTDFIRFMFEAIRQVMTTITTGRACPLPDPDDADPDEREDDGVIMVQLHKQTYKAIKDQMDKFRHAFDQEKMEKQAKARQLLFMLESRYAGIDWMLWSDLTQDLHAYLLGQIDGDKGPDLGKIPDDVMAFAKRWWSTLQPLVRRLDCYNDLLSDTRLRKPSSDGYIELEDTPTDLDLRDEAEGRAQVHAQAEDPGPPVEEDADLAQLLEECRRQQESLEFRNWEEWVLQHEMNTASTCTQRTRITVQAMPSSSTASSSSSVLPAAHLHVPTPRPGEQLRLTITLQPEHDASDLADDTSRKRKARNEDEVTFMQMPSASRQQPADVANEQTPRQLQHLLQYLLPGARRAVLRRLQRLLRDHAVQIQELRDDVQQELQDTSEEAEIVISESGLTMLLENVLRPLLQHLQHAPSAAAILRDRPMSSNAMMTGELAAALCHSDVETQVDMQSMTAPEVATTWLHDTSQVLMDILHGTVDEEPSVDRHNAMRRVLIQLIGDFQKGAAKVRILLNLISRLVPQPTSIIASSEHETRIVDSALRRIRDLLDCIEPTLLAPSAGDVLTAEWSVEGMEPVGCLAMDVMSYLENGRYDTSDDVSVDSPASVDTAETVRSNDVTTSAAPAGTIATRPTRSTVQDLLKGRPSAEGKGSKGYIGARSRAGSLKKGMHHPKAGSKASGGGKGSTGVPVTREGRAASDLQRVPKGRDDQKASPDKKPGISKSSKKTPKGSAGPKGVAKIFSKKK